MSHPKTAEDDYFRQQEAERRRDEAWERDQQAGRTEQAEPKTATAPVRRCPQCRTVLEPATVRQVEIERCPSCRGVWLQPGKLERLTESPGLLSRILDALRR